MEKEEKASQLRMIGRNKIEGDTLKEKDKKKEELRDIGGRKAIILLLLVTVVVSLILWLQSNLAAWLAGFVGPSKWTFSK